jgi:hypothetical protein
MIFEKLQVSNTTEDVCRNIKFTARLLQQAEPIVYNAVAEWYDRGMGTLKSKAFIF